VPLHRIHPERDVIDPAEAISGLRWSDHAPADRPYLALNMVSTADGKAAVEGRTRAISSETDRAIFHNLRTQADAVMAGAGTVRIERYGPVVKTQELQAKREREGVRPQPLAVIVSGRLHIPVDIPLLQDPDSHVVILTHSDDELSGQRASVDYLRSEAGPFDLRPLLGRLRTEYGVRSVLCEGGPTLNASLLPYGLVDELFLTISPTLAGGADALTIVAGAPLPDLAELDLVWALEEDSELFLRYRIRGARSDAAFPSAG
jgi:riboflavin-specific deaminase-like protein